jgi:hypothetical protein
MVRARHESRRAQRNANPFSTPLIALDSFNLFNDLYSDSTRDDSLIDTPYCISRNPRHPTAKNPRCCCPLPPKPARRLLPSPQKKAHAEA